MNFNFRTLKRTIEKYYTTLDAITLNTHPYKIIISDTKYSTCSYRNKEFVFVFSKSHLIESFQFGLYESVFVRKHLNKYGSKERSKYYSGWLAVEAIAIHEYCHMVTPNSAHGKNFIERYNALLSLPNRIENV